MTADLSISHAVKSKASKTRLIATPFLRRTCHLNLLCNLYDHNSHAVELPPYVDTDIHDW